MHSQQPTRKTKALSLVNLKRLVAIFTAGLLIFTVSGPAAADGGGAAELAAKRQDPLANLAALMTDNTASFKSGPDHDDEAYEINLQPVYSVNFPELGFTLIPRAMIPVVGVKPGTDLPRLGFEPNDEPFLTDRGDKGREWGLSDIVTQFFFYPDGAGRLEMGGRVRSACWSVASGRSTVRYWAGTCGASTGISAPPSSSPCCTTILSLSRAPTWLITTQSPYDRKVKGGNGNAWTIPLGLTAGRTFDMGGGHGFDLAIGGYHLPSGGRPQGGAKYQVKLGLSWIFPR